MAWAWDAPSGVYKDHALSSKIREAALANTTFMRWLSPEEGYGKGKGGSVTITRVLQLPLAGQVSEADRLPSGRPVIQTKQQSVGEWGFKIEVTQLEKHFSHFDIRNKYQKLLRNQISLTMDKMGADALKSTPYKFIPLAAGSVFDTDGTASTTADRNLTVGDLRLLRDELAGVLKVPPFANGNYVLLLSTKAARGLKNDSEYKDWISPTSAKPMMTGQLFDIEGFTIIETNHYDALSNGIGTGSILGEGIAFGDDAGFLAVVEEPEIRGGPPEDLGRFQQVGWVGTLQAGLTWETAANARAIHITSA